MKTTLALIFVLLALPAEARMKNVNGVDVPLTAAEETKRDAEEAAHRAAIPMRQWLRDMSVARQSMPDHMEDLWDAIGTASVPQRIKDAYAAKKAVRARKP